VFLGCWIVVDIIVDVFELVFLLYLPSEFNALLRVFVLIFLERMVKYVIVSV